MWRCDQAGCGEIFASEQAFMENVCKKHEQKSLDGWMIGKDER